MEDRMALIAALKAVSHTNEAWNVRITEFLSKAHLKHTNQSLVGRKISFQGHFSMEQDAEWECESIRPRHRS